MQIYSLVVKRFDFMLYVINGINSNNNNKKCTSVWTKNNLEFFFRLFFFSAKHKMKIFLAIKKNVNLIGRRLVIASTYFMFVFSEEKKNTEYVCINCPAFFFVEDYLKIKAIQRFSNRIREVEKKYKETTEKQKLRC